MSLKKKFRIHFQKEFENIFKNGKSVYHPAISLKYLPNNLDCAKTAVIVGKKIAKKANRRNLIKRRIKEIIRPLLPQIAGLSIVFLTKPGIEEKSFGELKEIIESLLEKINK